MKLYRGRKMKGFTLVELIVVMSIAGILLAIGIPGYFSLMQNNKVVAVTNKLAGSLSLARMEAIKRGQKVAVCPANATLSGCGTNAQWTQGWIVFTDANNNNAVDNATDLLSISNALPAGMNVTTSSSIISYDSTGFTSNGTASVTLNATGCKGKNSRTLNVNTGGRVSVVINQCS